MSTKGEKGRKRKGTAKTVRRRKRPKKRAAEPYVVVGATNLGTKTKPRAAHVRIEFRRPDGPDAEFYERVSSMSSLKRCSPLPAAGLGHRFRSSSSAMNRRAQRRR